jgi:hypothetical protein
MQKITRESLVGLLKLVENPTFVGITYRKTVRLSDGREITKKTRATYLMGASVARAYEKAGFGKPQARRWGTHASKCVIEHRGGYYIQLRAINRKGAVRNQYFNGHISVQYSEIKALLEQRSDNREIRIFDLGLAGIERIAFSGYEFEIID